MILMTLGLGGIIWGSDLVVNNLAALAAHIGSSQKIIAVTIISIGTSLPELVTTVVAAKKGENNMAIGNIVGSNIFNICIVLSLPVLILGEASTLAFGLVDIIFMLAAVILLWIFTAIGRELKRLEGIVLVAMYFVYGVYIFTQ
jgi:cation:H+ antiporter